MSPPVYAPRPLRSLPLWRIGPLRLKPYHIGSEAPDEARLAVVRAEVERMAARVEAEGASEGLGFVVLHDGMAGVWLLLDWWAHGDTICQSLSHDEGAGFVSVDHRPLNACVWELQVLCHERNAWVRHMMRADPSPGAYLEDRLTTGTV